jgi:hypothetical protein
VFADEIGSWMIPDDEKQDIVAYLASLAAVVSPASFTATALPLLEFVKLCGVRALFRHFVTLPVTKIVKFLKIDGHPE